MLAGYEPCVAHIKVCFTSSLSPDILAKFTGDLFLVYLAQCRMVLKVRKCCIMCENSVIVASAIGELQHFEYLLLGYKTGFRRFSNK